MKTIYYEDELNDDFAATQGIKTKPLPKDYKWIHKSKLWNSFADILYFLIVYSVVVLPSIRHSLFVLVQSIDIPA